jgi:predicted ATP-dependent endonuclease of OLD family
MRFIYFKFENFKGIEKLEIDLRKNPFAKVYPLVGLNESGKTTILEAINTFVYKPESLAGLMTEATKEIDMHDLIPINKRDNFKGYITIEGGLELEDMDRFKIKEILEKETGLTISSVGSTVTFTQRYFFQNSIHDKNKDQLLWMHQFEGKQKRAKSTRKLTNEEALKANPYIKENLPSILYFPNFLFEFPEKIYLEETVGDAKHKFYRNIIQDILDSIGNDLKIDLHLVDRIKSDEENNKRNLNSVLGKMNKKLTDVIFTSWNQIFGKQIRNKEIVLFSGTDDNGAFLEFNIQDNVDTYRIFERSLGFRWFFVFLLLTQFRTYRKKNKNVLFLLDEPASNLHPSAQTQLLKSFEKLSKVIYTTHSHYLINPQWLENTFVVKNDAIDYDNEEEYDSKQTNISIYKYREFATKFPSQTSYFQPILEILDYAPSNLEFVPEVVITEGKNDYYMFDYFQSVINTRHPTISIIPGISSTNLENIISLYLGWGRNFIVLLDADKEGCLQKKRYLDLFGISLENRIFSYDDIESDWKNKELEQLIDEGDKLSLQTKCYPDSVKFSKKVFHRSVQELYLKQEVFNFSKDTVDNLNKILAFIKNKLESQRIES